MSAPSPFADERTMSISRGEFEASIAKLGPSRFSSEGHPVFDVEGGTVEVRFSGRPGRTLGGLLALPQANVALIFDGVPDVARQAFTLRFDIAFQRGGG